ncbi:SAC3 domain-containing protein 1 [Zophobas morio]|uniref:SAC3 domain-containing protein 1 n=1 Tax=Zophobas morio TaxID=2755281 RepID=UPI00308344B2
MEKVALSIEGKCMGMCPHEEIKMRERERLLHVLEMVPGTEKTRHPKASRPHMVKSFSRSAAGKQIQIEALRPPPTLLKTVRYLLCDVITTKKVPWHVVYDFITDRLLAVRQDMVVQNISKAESITILQPIVRFHAYAAYQLCEHSVANFDATLNNNHLQECLKRLLHFYDSYDYLINCDTNSACNQYLLETRPEFEALYLIFNLGNDEALRRSLSIPEKCKTNVVRNAIDMSRSFQNGNFVRLCRLMKDMPPLLAALAALHLTEVRRRAFRTMSVAYHSKNLNFPLKILKVLLLYGSDGELIQDCKHYEIKTDTDCVYFTKDGFNHQKNPVSPRRELFIDDKCLQANVQSIILGM